VLWPQTHEQFHADVIEPSLAAMQVVRDFLEPPAPAPPSPPALPVSVGTAAALAAVAQMEAAEAATVGATTTTTTATTTATQGDVEMEAASAPTPHVPNATATVSRASASGNAGGFVATSTRVEAIAAGAVMESFASERSEMEAPIAPMPFTPAAPVTSAAAAAAATTVAATSPTTPAPVAAASAPPTGAGAGAGAGTGAGTGTGADADAEAASATVVDGTQLSRPPPRVVRLPCSLMQLEGILAYLYTATVPYVRCPPAPPPHKTSHAALSTMIHITFRVCGVLFLLLLFYFGVARCCCDLHVDAVCVCVAAPLTAHECLPFAAEGRVT